MGKKTIVTGFCQGGGESTVLELAKADVNPILIDVRGDPIKKVKSEIEKTGREVLPIQIYASKWEKV